MKATATTFLMLCLLIAINTLGQQQILNSGFESWTSNIPDQYACILGTDTSSNPTVIKSTDAHSGQYAARLQNQLVFGSFVQQSFMFYGSWKDIGGGSSIGVGTPFQSRPLRMKVWYKYNKTSLDSGNIYIYLSKWTGTMSQLIGTADLYIPSSVLSYTQATLNINYFSSATPDSIQVSFAATNRYNDVSAGTWLIVDDITLEYFPAAVTPLSRNLISLYPNPCTDKVHLAFQHSDEYEISITDMTGKTVLTKTVKGATAEMDMSGLTAGIYFMKLVTVNNAEQDVFRFSKQ
jgi:hypothetical protein